MLTYFCRGKGVVTEDVLTGCLGDLLAWWPSVRLVAQIAAGAEITGPPAGQPGTGIPLPAFDGYRVHLWPSWGAEGIPDLVLELLFGQTRIGYLVVEAKFGAIKSGSDTPAEPSDEGPEDLAAAGLGPDPRSLEDSAPDPRGISRDQLARYYRHGARNGPAVWVLYLTHHACAPREELEASLKAIQREHPDVAANLFWCSWRDLEQTLRVEAEVSKDLAFRRAACALAYLLQRCGMFHFSGRWPARIHPVETGRFYRSAGQP